MARGKAWRRYKDYTKAKRKRKIDVNIHNGGWSGLNYSHFWYDNLHQYSKNKIFCSCHMCSAKTRNKGKRRHLYGNYAPNINYSIMDLKKQQSMDNDEKESGGMKYVKFYGSNGYTGTNYEFYETFDDDATEVIIDEYSKNLAYENAEMYEYVVRGWGEDWDSEEEYKEYYNYALDYCDWEYCSKEEYIENLK